MFSVLIDFNTLDMEVNLWQWKTKYPLSEFLKYEIIIIIL